ncbi:MAG: acyl-CoA dehydrogenase family protein [Alphaproteobacteria bacterium]
MDLDFSDELRAFQAEIRGFIEANLPDDLRDKVRRGLNLHRDDYTRWQSILAAKGWLAYAWPAEYGGPGWSPVQQYIFQEELGRAHTPRIVSFALKMVGPVIYTFGTPEQKAFHLPRISGGIDWWCQGYSEPGAGSDLASLRTTAVRDGDHYIVNGTKTWTTQAQYADRMFCLVRTDPKAKPQEGISFLLMDMDMPGIEVKPIVTFEGGYEVNTVYLTDVRVPVANRIGEENKGWTYAKFLLSYERSGIARIAITKARLAVLREIAAEQMVGGRRLDEDPEFRERMADAEIQLTALEFTELRYLMAAEKGKAPGAEANMLKVRGTDLQQMVSELLMQAVGYYALPYIPEALEYGFNEPSAGPAYAAALAPNYFNMRKSSIYGGTNEIQRNIMAKLVLGL